MDKQVLIQNLVKHLAEPQRSERWAMYHLISPVIDFANSISGLVPYYEYQQPSAHKTYQKVDIALLNSETREPRVMVEAKRFQSPISAELIQKYLTPGLRGVVTNGLHWVLCMEGSSKILSFSSANGAFIEDALNELVAFIRGEEIDTSAWNDGNAYTGKFPVARAVRKQAATPSSSPAPKASTAKPNQTKAEVDALGLAAAVRTLKSVSPIEATLLSDLAADLSAAKPFARHLKFEVSETRVVLVDARVDSRNERRVGRIKLGTRHPDVIVRTSIVAGDDTLSSILPHYAHERGPHMRRFRLSDARETRTFAKELARVLNETYK